MNNDTPGSKGPLPLVPPDSLLNDVHNLNFNGYSAIPLCRPTENGGCTASWHDRPCPSAGKRPLIEGFRQFEGITAPEELILRWLRKFWPCNLGIVVPGFTVVAEADSPEAELEIAALSGGATDVAPCRERRPGRGRGWLFRWPAARPFQQRVHLGESGAIDLLAPGSIFVVPPSIHRTGHVYSWVTGKAPWDVDEGPFLPRELLTLHRPRANGGPSSDATAGAQRFVPRISPKVLFLLYARRKVRDYWAGEGKTYGDVSASGYDYAFACELVDAGVPLQEVAEAIADRPGAHRIDATYCLNTASRAASRRSR